MAPRARPSLTARTVAAARRRVDRPTVASGDPDGEDRLARSLGGTLPQLPPMVAYIGARTAWFDEQLLAACEAGARQVVIVGAGYDGRSLRFRQPGLTFIEVDHPATQADKVARLRRLGVDAADVRFVPVDFGRDSLGDALADAGHDAAATTHFLCEGVTTYLPLDDLRGLVGTLRAIAGAGSTLAIDFAEPGHDRPAISRLLLAVVRGGTAVMGERIVTLLSPEQVRSLLVDAGWSHVDTERPSERFPVVFALARID